MQRTWALLHTKHIIYAYNRPRVEARKVIRMTEWKQKYYNTSNADMCGSMSCAGHVRGTSICMYDRGPSIRCVQPRLHLELHLQHNRISSRRPTLPSEQEHHFLT